MNYCTKCGAELQKINDTEYKCANGHAIYDNPRGAVAVVLLSENNEVLFAKRAHEPAKDKYDLPGGFIDFGEDAYSAAVRELKEELGIDVSADKLEIIEVEYNQYEEGVGTTDVIFMTKEWQGELSPADDVAGFEWHAPDFIQTENFAWSYKRLYNTIQKLIAKP